MMNIKEDFCWISARNASLLFSFLIVSSLSAAQSVTTQPDESNTGNASYAALQSEEEMWEFLEMLCVEQPTKRCESDLLPRLRSGEIVPAPTYDEATAWKSLRHVIEFNEVKRELSDGRN